MEVYVATDLWGEKHNLRLDFSRSAPQSLAHLVEIIEAAFEAEVVWLAPPDVDRHSIPPFHVDALTVLVDEARSVWASLVSLAQLAPSCQIFVFQPTSSFHSDARGILPPPRVPVLAEGAARLTALDVAHIAFRRLAARGAAAHAATPPYASVAELKAALVLHGITGPLPPEVAGRATLDFGAWLRFCKSYPHLAEALLYPALRPASAGAGPEWGAGLAARFVSPPRDGADSVALSRRDAASPRMPFATTPAANVSPRRTPMARSARQRLVAERLSVGLSSRVTARDRTAELSEASYTHLALARTHDRAAAGQVNAGPSRRL